MTNKIKPLRIGGVEYLSEADAANYLGWSKHNLIKRRERGNAPPHKVMGGTRILYKLTDVDKWLEQNMVNGNSYKIILDDK